MNKKNNEDIKLYELNDSSWVEDDDIPLSESVQKIKEEETDRSVIAKYEHYILIALLILVFYILNIYVLG